MAMRAKRSRVNIAGIEDYFHPEKTRGPKHIEIIHNPGGQVRASKTVREFVRGIGLKKGIKDVGDLKPLFKGLASFNKRWVNEETMRRLYSKRTADDIIHSRAIPNHRGPNLRKGFHGCDDYGVALCASLNALGIPNHFERRLQTAMVSFKIGGRDYFIKTTHQGLKDGPKELTKERLRKKSEWLHNGKLIQGEDPWSLGLISFDEFMRGK